MTHIYYKFLAISANKRIAIYNTENIVEALKTILDAKSAEEVTVKDTNQKAIIINHSELFYLYSMEPMIDVPFIDYSSLVAKP